VKESVREPAVAGQFYPGHPERLRASVKSYLSSASERSPAIACMVPHAGYMYSGATAGSVFSHIDIPESCVILCPNHTGRGHPLALMSEGEWRTPLGAVAIDCTLAEKLMQNFPALTEDSAAHRSEHAIEVELPFLQISRPGVKFVPIAVGTAQLILLQQLGEAIAAAVKQTKQKVLIIASSDLNHYEDDATTRVKDRKAIEKVLALDAPGLYGTVINESISMCGFGPAVAMLTAARLLNATKAELIAYATSADASGDYDRVVGYAGIIIK